VPFRYLHEGKVFVAEWANAGDACEVTDSVAPVNKPWGRREMYWLCDSCQKEMQLVAKGKDVTAVPLGQPAGQGGRLLREIRISG
jgi:hypothetical protein